MGFLTVFESQSSWCPEVWVTLSRYALVDAFILHRRWALLVCN